MGRRRDGVPCRKTTGGRAPRKALARHNSGGSNYRVHIPKLHDFALDLACTDVVKHGKRGLSKPMPRPLYYRCLMTHADKMDDRTTTMMGMFRSRTFISGDIACAICMVDHQALGGGGGDDDDGDDSDDDSQDYSSAFLDMIEISHHDVNGAIDCINRFVSRCTLLEKYMYYTNSLHMALASCPCKRIRDVLIKHGAMLDTHHHLYLSAACGCGLVHIVEQSVKNGAELDQRCYINAINSGDSETIQYVWKSISKMARYFLIGKLTARDFSPDYCELLLNLGIFAYGKTVELYDITSVAVMQWLLNHNIVDVNLVMCDVVRSSLTIGGPSVDVLHYLIEDMHIPLPQNWYKYLRSNHIDLGVMDYLVGHGLDVSKLTYEVALNSPAYLRYWLDHGLNITQSDASEIMISVIKNQSVTVELLECLFCVLNVDIHAGDGRLGRLLAHTTDYAIADVLMRHGADVNARDDCGSTVLHSMSHHTPSGDDELDTQYSKFVSCYLSHGGDINALNGDGRTPLHVACQNPVSHFAHPDYMASPIDVLLRYGADVNIRDNEGKTPLHVACLCFHDPNIITNLIQHGADVDARDNSGGTALCNMCAGRCGIPRYVIPIAQVLIEYHADVNARNNHGESGLRGACRDDECEISSLLIVNGADVNMRGDDGATPLHIACGSVCIDAARLLLDHGADVNARANTGETPLHVACQQADDDDDDDDGIIDLLISHGANVQMCDDEGATPLFDAVLCNSTSAARKLIDRGVDVNARNNTGKTAIFIAVESSWTSGVELLVKFNVNVDIKDTTGKTALDYCTNDVISEILKGRSKTNVPESRSRAKRM